MHFFECTQYISAVLSFNKIIHLYLIKWYTIIKDIWTIWHYMLSVSCWIALQLLLLSSFCLPFSFRLISFFLLLLLFSHILLVFPKRKRLLGKMLLSKAKRIWLKQKKEKKKKEKNNEKKDKNKETKEIKAGIQSSKDLISQS